MLLLKVTCDILNIMVVPMLGMLMQERQCLPQL